MSDAGLPERAEGEGGETAGLPDQARPEALELMMASLRADAGDVGTFFQVLVSKLVEALGDRVAVERAGGLLHRDPSIKRVVVSLGDVQLEASRGAGSVSCLVRHAVRGVVLRSEEVGLDEWLVSLARGLAGEARRSAATRAALESLLT
ncbi:MAG: hypothetical protein ACRDYD_04210 [Acidimicrobiales bacterium]